MLNFAQVCKCEPIGGAGTLGVMSNLLPNTQDLANFRPLPPDPIPAAGDLFWAMDGVMVPKLKEAAGATP